MSEHNADSDAGRVNPYLRFAGMTWPNPTDPNETAHQLVYGQPSKADLMFAASVMNAYRHMIDLPQRERNQRVSQIRASVTASAERSE